MKPFDVAANLGLSTLPTYLELVDRQLHAAAHTTNSYLNKPLQRLLHVRGKRLRPALVIAVAASQKPKIDDTVVAAAVAIELLHLASLVHDDIIDNAPRRWNIPTINHREGVNQALLVGDYLVAQAWQRAASVSQQAAQVLAMAYTNLCDGQAREMSDLYNLNRTMESYLMAIRGKTAALFLAACQLGGLCAGVGKAHRNALANYGESFGMAFQLIDDVLDIVSSPDSGDTVPGSDLQAGVYTMPVLLSLQTSHAAKLRTLLKAKSPSLPDTRTILLRDGSITQTWQAAQKHNRQAIEALNKLDNTKSLAGLKNLPAAYAQWVLQQQVHKAYPSTIMA